MVGRINFEVSEFEDRIELKPVISDPALITFRIQVARAVASKDLVFYIKGEDIDGICKRNANLLRSDWLGGAYVYSPELPQEAVFEFGPISFHGAEEKVVLRRIARGKIIGVQKLISAVGVTVPSKLGNLSRRIA